MGLLQLLGGCAGSLTLDKSRREAIAAADASIQVLLDTRPHETATVLQHNAATQADAVVPGSESWHCDILGKVRSSRLANVLHFDVGPLGTGRSCMTGYHSATHALREQAVALALGVVASSSPMCPLLPSHRLVHPQVPYVTHVLSPCGEHLLCDPTADASIKSRTANRGQGLGCLLHILGGDEVVYLEVLESIAQGAVWAGTLPSVNLEQTADSGNTPSLDHAPPPARNSSQSQPITNSSLSLIEEQDCPNSTAQPGWQATLALQPASPEAAQLQPSQLPAGQGKRTTLTDVGLASDDTVMQVCDVWPLMTRPCAESCAMCNLAHMDPVTRVHCQDATCMPLQSLHLHSDSSDSGGPDFYCNVLQSLQNGVIQSMKPLPQPAALCSRDLPAVERPPLPFGRQRANRTISMSRLALGASKASVHGPHSMAPQHAMSQDLGAAAGIPLRIAPVPEHVPCISSDAQEANGTGRPLGPPTFDHQSFLFPAHEPGMLRKTASWMLAQSEASNTLTSSPLQRSTIYDQTATSSTAQGTTVSISNLRAPQQRQLKERLGNRIKTASMLEHMLGATANMASEPSQVSPPHYSMDKFATGHFQTLERGGSVTEMLGSRRGSADTSCAPARAFEGKKTPLHPLPSLPGRSSDTAALGGPQSSLASSSQVVFENGHLLRSGYRSAAPSRAHGGDAAPDHLSSKASMVHDALLSALANGSSRNSHSSHTLPPGRLLSHRPSEVPLAELGSGPSRQSATATTACSDAGKAAVESQLSGGQPTALTATSSQQQGGEGTAKGSSRSVASAARDPGPCRALVYEQGVQYVHVTVTHIQCSATGQPGLLVVQQDTSEAAAMETLLADLAESQLNTAASIFPKHIVEFLATSGNTSAPNQMAELARRHEDVTLLFMDIVGFTTMSKQVAPEQVMSFLNVLFGMFDELCDHHRIMKVETAGDCYIVAGGILGAVADPGLPVSGGFTQVLDKHDPADSAARVMQFAKDMLAVASTVLMPHNQQPVQIRIGMHTGDCVSGLIGRKCPKFAVFGDTMNTASRMESTCVPGHIQVSAATYALLKDLEPFTSTGGVEVKGKGLMDTYIWGGSVIGSPSLPNEWKASPSAIDVMDSAVPDARLLKQHCSSACAAILNAQQTCQAPPAVRSSSPGLTGSQPSGRSPTQVPSLVASGSLDTLGEPIDSSASNLAAHPSMVLQHAVAAALLLSHSHHNASRRMAAAARARRMSQALTSLHGYGLEGSSSQGERISPQLAAAGPGVRRPKDRAAMTRQSIQLLGHVDGSGLGNPRVPAVMPPHTSSPSMPQKSRSEGVRPPSTSGGKLLLPSPCSSSVMAAAMRSSSASSLTPSWQPNSQFLEQTLVGSESLLSLPSPTRQDAAPAPSASALGPCPQLDMPGRVSHLGMLQLSDVQRVGGQSLTEDALSTLRPLGRPSAHSLAAWQLNATPGKATSSTSSVPSATLPKRMAQGPVMSCSGQSGLLDAPLCGVQQPSNAQAEQLEQGVLATVWPATSLASSSGANLRPLGHEVTAQQEPSPLNSPLAVAASVLQHSFTAGVRYVSVAQLMDMQSKHLPEQGGSSQVTRHASTEQPCASSSSTSLVSPAGNKYPCKGAPLAAVVSGLQAAAAVAAGPLSEAVRRRPAASKTMYVPSSRPRKPRKVEWGLGMS
ncbi:guanylate cyclase domain-containing protein [Haematococcus lacustris]|uniref:Guanylate cyclase domain-containing protein n=1 Tax=Haematococcus lacustris TaxID=44745 RepID=A0A699Z6H5_HAELA|nr:guanylate cyclase domain-containing protein [Haematococcus lacustris]